MVPHRPVTIMKLELPVTCIQWKDLDCSPGLAYPKMLERFLSVPKLESVHNRVEWTNQGAQDRVPGWTSQREPAAIAGQWGTVLARHPDE